MSGHGVGLRGGIMGSWALVDPGSTSYVCPHLDPISFNFMQFSSKIWLNNRFFAPKSGVDDPI